MTRRQEREYIYNKYNGRCAYCGEKLQKGWHVDHLEPIKRQVGGGKKYNEYPERDNTKNKLPSCPACNINKHSMSLETFRYIIGNYINSLNNFSPQYRMAKKYGLIEETGKEVKFYFEYVQNG